MLSLLSINSLQKAQARMYKNANSSPLPSDSLGIGYIFLLPILKPMSLKFQRIAVLRDNSHAIFGNAAWNFNVYFRVILAFAPTRLVR